MVVTSNFIKIIEVVTAEEPKDGTRWSTQTLATKLGTDAILVSRDGERSCRHRES